MTLAVPVKPFEGQGPRRSRWGGLVLLMAVLFGLPFSAGAQEATVRNAQYGGFVSELRGRFDTDLRLKMSIIPQHQVLRGQAPLNCLLRLQWDGPGLLEGRLLCDVYAGERYVVSWKSPEVVITDQMSSYSIMLPPGPLNNDKSSYAIRAVFQTADRMIQLDPRDIPVPTRWSRQYVLGVIAPAAAAKVSGFSNTDDAPRVADLFQLAQFHPERSYASEFSVSATPVIPADVPVEPLRLTAFDGLLITTESLAELKPGSLEAIANWVGAGGRVCLVATGRVPTPLRAAWTRLVTQSAAKPVVTLDDDGQPNSPGNPDRVRIRRGCGRVLCLLKPADVSLKSWNEDVLWMFGVRRDRAREALSSGAWLAPPHQFMSQKFERLRAFGPAEPPLDALKRPLLPTAIRGVVPGKVILLLSLCLILIGPVDYFVLGRLGLRKWTWLFLPVVALSTTWAMVRMSREALGSQSFQRALSVADLDADQQVVRVSRFDLEFSAVEEIRKRDVQGALRFDFEPAIVGQDMMAKGSEQIGTSLAVAREPGGAPVRYANYVPSSYEFYEPVRQWSPRLFRETTFGADPRVDATALKEIDWAAIKAADWTTIEGRLLIEESIHKTLPDARVLIRTQLKTLSVTPAARLPETQEHRRFEALNRLIADATSTQQLNDLSQPYGLSHMVSERSPTCGPDFEDFAWVDPSNPRDAVLLIGIPGDDATIFRCRLDRPDTDRVALQP